MDAATATPLRDRSARAGTAAADRPPRQAFERGLERDERHAAASLLGLVQDLLHEVPGLISDRVELLALELGRAGAALAKIAALTLAAAILGITAWAALWVGVVMGLLALDWHWAVALGVVILVNAAAVAWALVQVKHLAGLLRLPATRRHLTLRASVHAVAANTLPVAEGATTQKPETEEAEAHASDANDASR